MPADVSLSVNRLSIMIHFFKKKNSSICSVLHTKSLKSFKGYIKHWINILKKYINPANSSPLNCLNVIKFYLLYTNQTYLRFQEDIHKGEGVNFIIDLSSSNMFTYKPWLCHCFKTFMCKVLQALTDV